MQSSLKKSLYLGLAALSFVSVAAVSTNASAKSYAKAGAYTKLTTKPETRNVEATGTNALYTKPGTVKGAKVVASKKVMGELATSKKSANYFRAYGQKVTNRGSVYYRVVTMDGKYRGYVYGGKTEGTFAAGVKSANTTTTATTPTKTTGYYLKDTSKNTIWTAPKNTQYKAKKVNLYGANKSTEFTVDQAATKTREGSLYYHVTSADKTVSGWIYAGKGYVAGATTQDLGGLNSTQADPTATNNNSVKVVYQTAAGAVGTSSTWVNNTATSTDLGAGKTVGTATTDVNGAGLSLSAFASKNVPSGYSITDSAKFNTAVAAATYGNTLYVNVQNAVSSKVQFVVSDVTPATGDAANVAVQGALTKGATLSPSDISVTGVTNDAITKLLTGDKDTLIGDNLGTLDTDLAAGTVAGAKTYGTSSVQDTNNYHYNITLDKNGAATNNSLAKFGTNVQVPVTVQLVSGAATAVASNNTWLG